MAAGDGPDARLAHPLAPFKPSTAMTASPPEDWFDPADPEIDAELQAILDGRPWSVMSRACPICGAMSPVSADGACARCEAPLGPWA
jgi:hypothetical protein